MGFGSGILAESGCPALPCPEGSGLAWGPASTSKNSMMCLDDIAEVAWELP